MTYNINSGIGLIERTYKLHTCETEVAMIVYVVTDFSGNVWGAYTKVTKAQAAKEVLVREYGQGYKVTEMEVNRNVTSNEAGTDTTATPE